MKLNYVVKQLKKRREKHSLFEKYSFIIKHKKTKNYKLFKYNLLKLQVYSHKICFNVFDFSNVVLEQTEIYLKQVLNIIFEYHVNHFKILFIGFPVVSNIKQIKLVHFTNHNFIPEKSWISGIFSNRFSIITYLRLIQSQKFSKSFNILLTIKTKPHLVVIFNQKLETNTINEFYKAGIPILSFNFNPLTTYKILGNFNFAKQNMKLTYFFLFYSLLKKTPLQKKRLPSAFFNKKGSCLHSRKNSFASIKKTQFI
jgi:hypothetical protein